MTLAQVLADTDTEEASARVRAPRSHPEAQHRTTWGIGRPCGNRARPAGSTPTGSTPPRPGGLLRRVPSDSGGLRTASLVRRGAARRSSGMDGTGPTARGAGRGGRSGKRESAASPVAVSRASATIREVKRPVEVLTGTPEELVADAAVMRHTRASDGGWRAAEPTDGCPTRISPHCVSRSSALDSRPRDTLGGGTWRIGHHADRSPVPHGRLPMMGGSPWSSSPIPPAPCARSPCTPATAGHPWKARSSTSRVGLVREGSPSTRRAEVFAGASTPESERGIANGHQFVGSPCDGRHERDWIWCSGGSWGCRWTRRFGIPGSSPRSGNAC